MRCESLWSRNNAQELDANLLQNLHVVLARGVACLSGETPIGLDETDSVSF
jgi:hypothetical protein